MILKICLSLILFFPFFAFATFPTENFNSYAAGDLSGNNGGTGWSAAWGTTGGCNVLYDVQTSVVQEGANAVGSLTAGADTECFRDLTANSTDLLVWSWRHRKESATTRDFSQFLNSSGDHQHSIEFRTTGQISIIDDTTQTNIQAYTADTWYQMETEFDYTNEQFRIRFDAGSWSAVYKMRNYTTVAHTNTGRIRFSQAYDTINFTSYWDNFIETVTAVPVPTQDLNDDTWFQILWKKIIHSAFASN